MENKEEIKEDFCPSCLIVPLAVVGTGAATAGELVPQKHKKWKKVLLWSGVLTIISVVALIIYYHINKENCKSCKLKPT